MTEPPTHTPMIHGAITAIIAELPAFGKDAEMTDGPRYSYRSIDSMLPHFKELFARHGVHVAPVHEVLRDEPTTTRGGSPQTRVVVKGMFRFVSAEDGSSVACQTIGEARDSGDKAYNKAMTAAYKYALIQTFAVADADDPDHHRPELEGAPLELPQGAKVSYPNFDALRALGPALKAADLADEVKLYAETHNIDMAPGHDEEGLGEVVKEANRLLAEVLSPNPPAVRDIVAEAKAELAARLAGVEGEPAVPADGLVDLDIDHEGDDPDPLAKIMEEFGPGTEVVDGGDAR